MRLGGKVSASVDVVSGALHGNILESLLFILYTFKLFHIVGNYIVDHADGTTIFAVIPRPLSRSQVIVSLKQDLAAIKFWCLIWHIRPNPKKTEAMVLSRSQTIATGYDDLTLAVLSLRN